jgi:cysteine desulfurase / selenocysteine lyase
VHEFPSNHYPWALQRRRGVELVLLSDTDPIGGLPPGRPRGWSMEELEARTTPRTRVVAISHVQFTSGYAADLARLGAFCRERGIDLVVDAAQSLGVLPLQPETHGIAAVAASAWKWLLGPRGGALLYTAPDFRDRLAHTTAGDAMMKHRFDYLNHAWDPEESARRFEYSTLPWEHLLAIETVVEEVFLRYGMEAIRREVMRHQDRLVEVLASGPHRPLVFPEDHRSGILSVATDGDPRAVAATLRERGVMATAQAGYLRLAPHFYLTDEDVARAADALGRT